MAQLGQFNVCGRPDAPGANLGSGGHGACRLWRNPRTSTSSWCGWWFCTAATTRSS